MNFATALTELNTLLSDSDNFTFTTDQKNQFLTTAWNDSWVATPVWDNSLSYAQGTFEYVIPGTITAVGDVYFQRTSTDYPERIDNELWSYENVAGVPSIIFEMIAERVLSNNYQLYLKGRYKLTTSDDLPTVELQNYVLSHAGYLSLRNLGYQKTLRFLRNDTTLADILNLRKDFQADMLSWRQQLQQHYESV
jgi:hypothetical protein